MKKMFFICTLMVLAFLNLKAQQPIPEPTDRKGKIFLVPEFWLSFGSSTYIDVAPMVGYHVNDRFTVGIGPHYIFQSYKNVPPYPNTQTHTFGLKGFARFALITNAEEFLPINLFSDLFVHVEYEGLNLDGRYYGSVYNESRFLYHGFLVGGGVNQRVGMYNSVSFMVLWDVNETSSSPYSNPVFRIGFNTFF
jgi:hypothetical protein